MRAVVLVVGVVGAVAAAAAGCGSRDVALTAAAACLFPPNGTLVSASDTPGEGAPDGSVACTAPDGETMYVPYEGGFGKWICGLCGGDTYLSVICAQGRLACIGEAGVGADRQVVEYCKWTIGEGACARGGAAR